MSWSRGYKQNWDCEACVVSHLPTCYLYSDGNGSKWTGFYLMGRQWREVCQAELQHMEPGKLPRAASEGDLEPGWGGWLGCLVPWEGLSFSRQKPRVQMRNTAVDGVREPEDCLGPPPWSWALQDCPHPGEYSGILGVSESLHRSCL